MEILKKITNIQIILFGTILIIFFYGNTINFDYNLDDSYYLSNIPEGKNFFTDIKFIFRSTFNQGEYRPITTLILYIESLIFGKEPSTFHLFNILFYIILMTLCFNLIVRGKILKKKESLLFFILIFIIHPTHTEVVASIKNQESLLSGIFLLLGFHNLISVSKGQYWRIPFVLLTFLASIFSKVDTFPLILSSPILFLLKDNNTAKEKNWDKYKFVIFCFVISFIIFILHTIISNWISSVNPMTIISQVEQSENPFIKNDNSFRITSLLYSLGYYLTIGLIPYNLFPYYGFYSELNLITGCFALLILFIFPLIQIFRHFTDFQPRFKKYLFALSWYWLSIFPFLNLMIYVAGIYAVRYLFIASIGLILWISIVFVEESIFKIPQKIKSSFIIVLVLYYTIISYKEINEWKDFGTLIESNKSLKDKSSTFCRIATNHYLTLMKKNKADRLYYLEKATNYAQSGLMLNSNDIDLLNSIAIIHLANNETSLAEKNLKKAIALDSLNLKGYKILISLLENQNRTQEMEYFYTQILNRIPKDEILVDYYNYILKSKDYKKGISILEKVSNIPSVSFVAEELTGNLFLLSGDTTQAINSYYNSFQEGLENEELRLQIIEYYEKIGDQNRIDSIKSLK